MNTGTPITMANHVLDHTPGARDVHVAGKPGIATVHLKLRWWTWLTLGIWHLWAKRRARKMAEQVRAAGIVVRVYLFQRV